MSVRDPIRSERRPIAGIETFVRYKAGAGTPTLFVHGNPTHSADWLPFLTALEGPGIALDLPNFGRSERPDRGSFDAGMHAYAEFLDAAMDELVPERFNLVVHDWGGVALHPAQRRPERVAGLVVINAVPMLAGYRWHWVARLWRRRGVGWFVNATRTRFGTALILRQARAGYKPMPSEFVDMVWESWDRGTSNAILSLYRSADPPALEAAGAHLERLRCPALVVWGGRDPYIPPEFGDAYAARLPNAEVVALEDAGHWPWLDRPEVVERVTAFLGAGASRAAAI